MDVYTWEFGLGLNVSPSEPEIPLSTAHLQTASYFKFSKIIYRHAILPYHVTPSSLVQLKLYSIQFRDLPVMLLARVSGHHFWLLHITAQDFTALSFVLHQFFLHSVVVTKKWKIYCIHLIEFAQKFTLNISQELRKNATVLPMAQNQYVDVRDVPFYAQNEK